jgi:hypothetical protein
MVFASHRSLPVLARPLMQLLRETNRVNDPNLPSGECDTGLGFRVGLLFGRIYLSMLASPSPTSSWRKSWLCALVEAHHLSRGAWFMPTPKTRVKPASQEFVWKNYNFSSTTKMPKFVRKSGAAFSAWASDILLVTLFFPGIR